ncbi:MAG: prolyl-tRNA synthetase, partial [Parcubacteria group bacterium GW2011_GWA1_48_11b]
RGGFVFKNSAGVYSFLPLGWRVMSKVIKIIREEMNAIGGQEMFMPALGEKKYLEATNRWNLDVGFDVVTKKNPDADSTGSRQAGFALGWTHEEVLTAIASKYVSSYKDLLLPLISFKRNSGTKRGPNPAFCAVGSL